MPDRTRIAATDCRKPVESTARDPQPGHLAPEVAVSALLVVQSSTGIARGARAVGSVH